MSNTSAEFDFRLREPVRPLARFVESVWYARGTIRYAREKIAPTGSTVAVFVLGPPIIEIANDGEGIALRANKGFLIGPHDRPHINEPTGETFAVGIVGTPIGCESVFGIRPSHLRGQALDLMKAWPAAVDLRGKMLAQTDPEAMLDLLESYLASHHVATLRGLDRCERAVSLLRANPTRPIRLVAEEIGVSHGYLDREFTRVVGLTPRALARLFKLRYLVKSIDVHAPVDWTDLAAELGWFDQAHLIRDFKRYTGSTPTQYIAAQRAAFTADQTDDAAGFVPEF